jgi:hypothetical protein
MKGIMYPYNISHITTIYSLQILPPHGAPRPAEALHVLHAGIDLAMVWTHQALRSFSGMLWDFHGGLMGFNEVHQHK